MGVAAHDAKHHTDMDCLADDFKGNKNKTRKSLGQSSPEGHYSCSITDIALPPSSQCPMHVTCTFKGNKNKTGSKLGNMQNKNKDTTTCNTVVKNTTTTESTLNSATFQFQGNKNGIGTKLGPMAETLYPQDTSVIQQPQLEIAQWSYPVTGNTLYLSGKRARQIPDSVYAPRYQSLDHKNLDSSQ